MLYEIEKIIHIEFSLRLFNI